MTKADFAHNEVLKAKKAGLLVPPSHCTFCKNTRVVAHHPDYDDPLRVIWVCRKCHSQIHHDEKVMAIFMEFIAIQKEKKLTHYDMCRLILHKKTHKPTKKAVWMLIRDEARKRVQSRQKKSQQKVLP